MKSSKAAQDVSVARSERLLSSERDLLARYSHDLEVLYYLRVLEENRAPSLANLDELLDHFVELAAKSSPTLNDVSRGVARFLAAAYCDDILPTSRFGSSITFCISGSVGYEPIEWLGDRQYSVRFNSLPIAKDIFGVVESDVIKATARVFALRYQFHYPLSLLVLFRIHPMIRLIEEMISAYWQANDVPEEQRIPAVGDLTRRSFSNAQKLQEVSGTGFSRIHHVCSFFSRHRKNPEMQLSRKNELESRLEELWLTSSEVESENVSQFYEHRIAKGVSSIKKKDWKYDRKRNFRKRAKDILDSIERGTYPVALYKMPDPDILPPMESPLLAALLLPK